MRYYESNLRSLDCFQPDLFDAYQKRMQSGFGGINMENRKHPEEILSTEARDRECILHIRIDSREYRMNSAYRPLEEARKWASQYEFRNLNTVVAMFGLGNGLFANALCARMGEEDSLLIYEPCPEIFEHVLMHYDITGLIERRNTVIIVEGINDAAFHRSLVYRMELQNVKSQLQCIHPSYDRIFDESCLKFYKIIKNAVLSNITNINTGIRFREAYIGNVLKNIKFLTESISLEELKEFLPKNLPAIVVAAGPSARDNLEELKKAKGRAVIFVVDRMLDYLLDEGIEPDFVVTIDALKWIGHFSRRKNIMTPLICLAESNPEILHVHKGAKIICSDSSFLNELYRREKKQLSYLVTGGSVALAAYSICVELGFARVILVGQDLAYRDGMSHASGVMREAEQGEEIFIDGIGGEQVKSRNDWKQYVLQYQDLIEYYSNVEVIDAKERGALIKGTIVMSLREAVNRFTIEGTSWKLCILSSKNRRLREETIIQFLKDQLVVLDKIKRKAQAAIKDCDHGIQRNKHGEDIDKIIKKLKQVNDYIKEQKIYSFLEIYIIGSATQHIAEVGRFTDDVVKDSENTLKATRAVYQVTIDAVDFTKNGMQAALKDIEEHGDGSSAF